MFRKTLAGIYEEHTSGTFGGHDNAISKRRKMGNVINCVLLVDE